MHIGIDVRVLKNRYMTGIEVYTRELLKALLRQDEKNRFSLVYAHPFSISNKLIAFEQNPTVTIKHIKFSNKLFSLLWKYPGHPAIDVFVPGGFDCFIAPHINIIPVKHCKKIVIVHDVAFVINERWYSPWDRLWHKFMASTSLPQADLLICVSEYTKQVVIERYGIPESKVVVVYPGIGSQETRILNEKKPPIISGRYILFIGTLEARKNIVMLVRAFNVLAQLKNFQDVQLIICGKKGWKAKEIFDEIRQCKDRDRIQYRGYTNEDEKQNLLQNATVFAYPSLYEGFGFPPLEALLCGTPVITSSTTVFPEVCGEWVTMVDPTNLDALVSALHDTVDNPRRENIADKILNKFSWDSAARKVIKYAKELTKKYDS